MSDELVNSLAEKAISVDAWFARPKHRPRVSGDDIFILEYHVSAEDWWQHFQTHPRNVHVKLTTWIEQDEEDARHEAMKEKTKGEFGLFWQSLFASGFQHCPEVRDEIDEVKDQFPGDAKAIEKLALRKLFAVESLTQVSPEAARQQFKSQAAQTIIEQAERKAEEREAKSCLI